MNGPLQSPQARDPAALLAGGQPESHQQIGLAGAGVPEQHDRLAGDDRPRATRLDTPRASKRWEAQPAAITRITLAPAGSAPNR